MMDCKIDWEALPVVAEIYGIIDIHELINNLVTIRDFVREQE